jgi:ABC-2 type transport system ATP-binding protein
VLPAIKCENLTKNFGTVAALDNLNLEVAERSVFGFLGPNGAGKTTTVKLLMGLSRPTAGTAWIDGEEIGSAPLRGRIGFLPDVPAFYSWMSGREYLYFTARLHHLPVAEIKTRCEELLELVELKKAAGRRVGGYSRGMKQRLGIAQALVNRPSVLFLDEPTSALDPMGRRDVLSLITRLKESATIFMSTHILSDVERVCDTVGIIDKGRLVTVAAIEDLKTRYSLSAFELEFEEDSTAFAASLQALEWVEKVETRMVNQSPVLRIKARDVSLARREMPRLAAGSGLTLLRYQNVLPSLEDIFVELVGGAA